MPQIQRFPAGVAGAGPHVSRSSPKDVIRCIWAIWGMDLTPRVVEALVALTVSGASTILISDGIARNSHLRLGRSSGPLGERSNPPF
jgi:hypothetical protein